MSPQWIVVIGIIIVIYFIFIKKRPNISKKNDKNNKDEIPTDEMIECASCGTYVSIDETILSNNKYYCSKECLGKK